jgi:ribosome-binding factor A
MVTTKTSARLERISSAILFEVSQVLLREIDDPRLKRAQLMRAVVSKDLSIAKIYFVVADENIDPKALAKQLNNASGLFRHHMAEKLDLRVTPEIKFYYDEDAAKAAHLLDLMAKL